MTAEELFWRLAAELQADDARIVEGTIMNVPKPDRRRWLALLREGVAFVG